MKEQEYRYATLWIEEDEDIIFARYAEKLEIDIEIAKELVQNRLDFANDKSVYYVIDLENLKSVSKEAREYMSQPENGLKGIIAGAFISNKPLTTVVINFFLFINKPAVPAKFFTNKEDALNWVVKMREERKI